MLAPNAQNATLLNPNPTACSCLYPNLHHQYYLSAYSIKTLLCMQIIKIVIFAWVRHVDKICFMDSGTNTLSVDQVNVKNLVQFHNQANPGSNKYLFWLMKKFKNDLFGHIFHMVIIFHVMRWSFLESLLALGVLDYHELKNYNECFTNPFTVSKKWKKGSLDKNNDVLTGGNWKFLSKNLINV